MRFCHMINTVGVIVFVFIYITSMIQLKSVTRDSKKSTEAKNNIIATEMNTFSRSLLKHNEMRMDRLRQQYNGLLNLSSFNQPQSDKTMVYSCHGGCNGWGDRIRGLASVYILALLTQRRFMIDMDNPCPLSRFLRPNIVDWTYREPKDSSNRKRTRLVISSMTADRENHTNFMHNLGSKDFVSEWKSYDDVWITTNGYLIKRVLRNPLVNSSWLISHLPPNMTIDSKLFPLLFEHLFKPTEILTHAVERILHLPYKRLICVHIRVGRNPSNPLDKVMPFRENITRTMIAFLNKRLPRLNADGSQIFIASDSDMAIDEVRHRFRNFVVTVPGSIMHIDARDFKGKLHLTERQKCAGFLKALTEFLVLGECDVSILSRSGFSAWASRRKMKSDGTIYLFNDTLQSIVRVRL